MWRRSPSIPKVMLLLWLTMLMVGASKPYSITYYDCHSPKTLYKYARSEICKKPITPASQSKQYQILQRENIHKLHGFSCTIQTSTFVFRCGVWSHLKLALVPKINHYETIPLSWCNDLAKRRKFKTEHSGTSYPLELNTWNIISQVERGSLIEGRDKVTCTGETYHSGNQIHTNMVVLKEYKVLIRKESFTTDGEAVEVKSAGLSLPCKVRQRGCATGTATYIWEPTDQECPLHLVREMRATSTMGSYLVDESSKILINTTGLTRLMGCEFEIIKTNYPELYLVEKANKVALPTLSPGELHLEMESRIAHDYLEYHEEQREVNAQHNLDQNVCESHKHQSSTLPVHIAGDLFSRDRGDLIFTFRCENRTAPIL